MSRTQRVLVAALSAGVAALGHACQRHEAPVGAASAIAQSAGRNPIAAGTRSAAAPNTAPASQTQAAQNDGRFALHISERRVEQKGALALYARIPELGVDELLLSVADNRSCGLVPLPQEDGSGGATPPGVRLTCGSDSGVSIRLDPGALRLGERALALPAKASVTLPSAVEQLPPPSCEGAPSSTLEVRLQRRNLPRGAAEADRVDSLGFELSGQWIELARLARVPTRCASSRVFPRSTQLRVTCSASEAGLRLTLTQRAGNLLVEEVATGLHEDELRARYALRMPCGVAPHFQRFALRDAAFRPFGGPCGDGCRQRSERCEDGCYARHASEDGVLSSAGQRCAENCAAALTKCELGCRGSGSQP